MVKSVRYNRRVLLFASLLVGVGVVCAEELSQPSATDYLQEIRRKFTPEKPTVVMDYDVRYRFLKLNLMQVASATIEMTEGLWRLRGATENVPCCVMDIRVQSPSAAREAERGGRIYINDRIISVVTMPDLETLYYLKMTDEYLNPIIGARKDIRNFHVYDLTSGELDFFCHDYNLGESMTNVTGATDMASQGKEVARVLSMLSDVYHERREPISPESDFRVFVNCDSVAVPFAARSTRDNIRSFGGEYCALKVDVMPAREAPRGVRTRDFSMWAASFVAVADRTEDTSLQKIAAEVPAWGMTPLIADYGMALGSMRCSLVSMGTRDSRKRWFVTAKTEPQTSGM